MAIDCDPHVYCVHSYSEQLKIWVSDLDPIVHNPQLLREKDIDVLIALLEEDILPRDFRVNVPSYIKHHFFHARPNESLHRHFYAMYKVIHSALEYNRNVLVYARSADLVTSAVVCFFIKTRLLAPKWTLQIPMRYEKWTPTYLEYLRAEVFPSATLHYDQIQDLYLLERLHEPVVEDYDVLN